MKNSRVANPRMLFGRIWPQNVPVSGTPPFVGIRRTLPQPCHRPGSSQPSVAWPAVLGILLLAFLIVPLLELYLFVQVSAAIGFWAALFWIVAVSAIGAWLVKREGMGAWRRANA